MADYFKLAYPTEYYYKFLENEIRPDGRKLSDFRPTALNIGSITTSDGSAFVTIGNTKVICGIKAEVTLTKPGEKIEDYLIPNVDLNPISCNQFKTGPPIDKAQCTSHFMQQFLSSFKVINLEDLCKADKNMYWILFCDIICLEYDGNLLDACGLSLITALYNLQLPTVSLNEETGLLEFDMMNKFQLQIQNIPVLTSFSIFDEEIILSDPTKEEEDLSKGLISIAFLKDGSSSIIYKPGGETITIEQLNDCMKIAKNRTHDVIDLMQTCINNKEFNKNSLIVK